MTRGNLCLRCMGDMIDSAVCPACGWSDNTGYDIQYIRPGTVLSGRYLLGHIVRKNGEGALYAGYDHALSAKVFIREYFPVTIAQRALDTGKITPLAGCGAQYKALMSDFVDICNEIKRLGVTEPVVPIENVISENNTVYAIYRGLKLISLEEYIKKQGGRLSPRQTLALLLPVCNALGILHNHGQIHRGISPHTIYVDAENKLYLWDFALSATRTSGSELDAELFSGYTALEQYSPNGWQGSWTDVYAMGALFYRCLTGIVPPKSSRISHQNPLTPLEEALPELPRHLSDAVEEAMIPSTEGRTQSIQTFASRLVESRASSTAVYDTNKVTRERAPKRSGQRSKQGGGSFRYAMVGLVAMLVMLGGVIWYVWDRFLPDSDTPANRSVDDPSQAEESSPDGTALAEMEIPNLVGRRLSDVENDPAFEGLFTFSPKEDFNDNYEEGFIYDQAPAQGTKTVGHATVRVYVSKGNTKVKVPDIVGQKLSDAQEALSELDIFSVNIIQKYSPSSEPGVVLETIPAVGASFDPKKDTLNMIVSMELPVSEATAPPEESQTYDDDRRRWDNPDIQLPNESGTLFR